MSFDGKINDDGDELLEMLLESNGMTLEEFEEREDFPMFKLSTGELEDNDCELSANLTESMYEKMIAYCSSVGRTPSWIIGSWVVNLINQIEWSEQR
jgi:hypothetical protein